MTSDLSECSLSILSPLLTMDFVALLCFQNHVQNIFNNHFLGPTLPAEEWHTTQKELSHWSSVCLKFSSRDKVLMGLAKKQNHT